MRNKFHDIVKQTNKPKKKKSIAT